MRFFQNFVWVNSLFTLKAELSEQGWPFGLAYDGRSEGY